jgi:hypothetical protein
MIALPGRPGNIAFGRHRVHCHTMGVLGHEFNY